MLREDEEGGVGGGLRLVGCPCLCSADVPLVSSTHLGEKGWCQRRRASRKRDDDKERLMYAGVFHQLEERMDWEQWDQGRL